MLSLRIQSGKVITRICASRSVSSPRFQSTVADAVLKDIEENLDTPPSITGTARKAKNSAPLAIYLSYLTSNKAPAIPVDDLFKRIENAIDKEANSSEYNAVKATRLNNENIHKIINYLSKQKSVTSQAAASYRLLTILKQYHMANVSHFERVMEEYLKEGKAEDALSLFVESLEYEKSLPDTAGFLSVRNPQDIKSTLYVAFLLSCHAKEQICDFELFKQLSGMEGFDVNLRKFNKLLNVAGFDPEFVKFAKETLRRHRDENADPNDTRNLSQGLNAALNRQISRVEKVYDQVMRDSEASGLAVSDETYAKLMHMFSVGLKPARAHKVWNQMVAKRGKAPESIDLWNELLFSFTKVKSATTEEDKAANVTKLKTFYNYIDENFNADATTYSHLVAGYVANDEFEEAFQLIQQLSGKGIKGVKLTDEIVSNYLIGLIKANRADEARNLLVTFIKSNSFKPDIKVMNTFLSYYNSKKLYKTCDEIIELVHQFHLNPDIATYTMLIDIILKNSQNSNLGSLNGLLEPIIEEMKVNKINFFNSVTLTAVINGLGKDGSMESARLLLDFMKAKKIPIPFMLYTGMVNAETMYGDLSHAKQLFQESIAGGVRPNTPYYNAIINGCLRQRDLKGALDYYNALRSDSGLEPNFFTFFFLLRYLNDRKYRADVIQQIVEDLAQIREKSSIELGKELPKILVRLQSQNIKLPPVLAEAITPKSA